MKILFDAAVFEHPHVGIAKAALYLFNACNSINSDIQFEGFCENDLVGNLPDIIQIYKLRKYPLHKQYSAYSINKLIQERKPDIVYFPWNGRIPGVLKNVKTVMTLHDILPMEIPNYFSGRYKCLHIYRYLRYKRSIQKSLKYADVVFTDSEYSKSKIIENFLLVKEPVVLPFGPTITAVSLDDVCIKEPFFIYVGGYDRRKGIRNLLESFLHLYKAKGIIYTLYMIGKYNYIDSEVDVLLNECIKLNIVKQMGYVSDSELANYYNYALGLIYLSKHEGFGLPPLEAMSLGCPVVTTTYTSLPEICGDAVIYVEPDTISEVSQAIERLATNEGLRRELIIKGKEQASQFSWEKSVRIFLGILASL